MNKKENGSGQQKLSMKGMNITKIPSSMTSLYTEYTKQVEGLHHQLKAITGILST